MRTKLDKESEMLAFQKDLDIFIETGVYQHTAPKIGNIDEKLCMMIGMMLERTTIFHSKMIGTVDNLNRIHSKNPDVLFIKDDNDRIPLAYAAWSGDVDVLNWINTHHKNAFSLKDREGCSLYHYAAWSGKKEAIDWIYIHGPKMLEKSNSCGLTPIHYVAMSGEALTLNHALSLTAKPHSWVIPGPFDHSFIPKKFDQSFYDTLIEALKSNKTLTNLSLNTFYVNDKTYEEIQKYLARNREIQHIKMKFAVFMQGLLQANSPISILNCVNLELYSSILSFLMPENTTTLPMIQDIVTRSDKPKRVLALVSEELQRLTVSNKENTTFLSFSTNSEYQCSNGKIDAFNELKRIIESDTPDLVNQFIAWEEKNKATLATKKTTIGGFFHNTLHGLTRTEVVIQNIKNILGLESKNMGDTDDYDFEPVVLLF